MLEKLRWHSHFSCRSLVLSDADRTRYAFQLVGKDVFEQKTVTENALFALYGCLFWVPSSNSFVFVYNRERQKLKVTDVSLSVVIIRCNSSVPVTNSLAQIKWFWVRLEELEGVQIYVYIYLQWLVSIMLFERSPNYSQMSAVTLRTDGLLMSIILRCFEFNNCIVRLFFNLNKKFMKRRGLLYLLSGIACIVVETIPQTSFEFSRGNKTVDIQSSSYLW